MSWSYISDGRWSLDGDRERHLLLHAGDRLVEFHGGTVHVYRTAGQVDPEQPLGRPEGPGPDFVPAVTWLGTDLRGDLTEAGDDAVWGELADPKYTEGLFAVLT